MHKMISEKLISGDTLLPTESRLCTEFDCSRQTIRKVLHILKEENLITSRQGSGHRLTGLSPDARKNHICLLFTRPDEYIYPSLIYDIERGIASDPSVTMAVSVSETGGDYNKERNILKKLLENPPRAVLAECFSLMATPNVDLFRALEAKGCSVIFLYGVYPNMEGFPSIREGAYDAVYDLVKKLYATGHTRIRGVFKNNNPQEQSRFYGFISALRDLGLPFGTDAYLMSTPYGIPDALNSTNAGTDLETLALRSDALIFCSDEVAYPCVRYLMDHGCLNLNEKPVYSFDSSYLAQVGNLKLPSITHTKDTLASAVSERILSIIKGQPKISIVLPYSQL